MVTTQELDSMIEHLRKRARKNTVSTYSYALSKWMNWLQTRQPTRESAQDYIDELDAMGKSPATINIVANAIRRYFKFRGQSISLDAPGIKIHEPKYVTTEELSALIGGCKTALERVLLIGLFDTATRINEFLNIELHDIDWEQGLITVTRKGGRIARVNISEKALDALKEWIEARKSESEKVFMEMGYLTAWATIRDIGKRVGIPIHPHLLRHSRAVQMLMAGTDIYVVQQHLGHVNIGTTMNIYGRLMPVHLKAKIPDW